MFFRQGEVENSYNPINNNSNRQDHNFGDDFNPNIDINLIIEISANNDNDINPRKMIVSYVKNVMNVFSNIQWPLRL